jgi:hypothetical protein
MRNCLREKKSLMWILMRLWITQIGSVPKILPNHFACETKIFDSKTKRSTTSERGGNAVSVWKLDSSSHDCTFGRKCDFNGLHPYFASLLALFSLLQRSICANLFYIFSSDLVRFFCPCSGPWF